MRYKELEAELVANLEALKVTAAQKRLTLIKKKHHIGSGIIVSTAFSQPQLSRHYSSLIADTIVFCKKYEGLKPQNVEELIRYCGGLKATVKSIQYAYEFELPLRSELDDDLEFLLYAIESVLLKAIGATNQKQQWLPQKIAEDQGKLGLYNSQYKMRLPICALCWKRTFAFSFFCKDHHSIRNKKAYNSAARKVLSFTERYSSNLELKGFAIARRKKNSKETGLVARLFNMVNDSVPPVFDVLSHQTDRQWKSYADSIVIYTEKNYPISFHYLKQAEELTQFTIYNSLLNWGYMVIKSLENSGFESSRWKASKELIHLNNDQLRIVILNILARFEATHRIYQPLKSGPMKGYGADLDRRKKLTELYHKQLEGSGRVNLSQIARDIKLSRQRVSVLVKELKLGN
ncbi:hypothetical protein PD716_14250 [Vibrio gigantis]|uniref:hypothetical protein n=1 Tax=Vibrio gigantis TaxID=296199 RepID=UPI002FC6B5C5